MLFLEEGYAEYKYYDMHNVIERALNVVKDEFGKVE